MKSVFCILASYFIGSLSPSALIAKIKHENLRESGTKNLGATNTMLVLGKKYGIIVMLLDLFKGFFVVKMTGLIAWEIEWLSLASGLSAIIGHCFPFYMHFKGGKGLASYGGVVLAYKPTLFLFLLATCIILMLIVNYTFIVPYYSAAAFSLYVCITSGSIISSVLAVAASALIMAKHYGNLVKAKNGQDLKVRSFIKENIFK